MEKSEGATRTKPTSKVLIDEDRAGPLGYLSGRYSNAVTALCLVDPDTRTGTALENRRKIERVTPNLLISQFTIGKTRC